jgi:hypothetical protein
MVWGKLVDGKKEAFSPFPRIFTFESTYFCFNVNTMNFCDTSCSVLTLVGVEYQVLNSETHPLLAASH